MLACLSPQYACWIGWAWLGLINALHNETPISGTNGIIACWRPGSSSFRMRRFQCRSLNDSSKTRSHLFINLR
ncbi:hypothetical protein CPB84DRAFT_1785180 [Gymnopilus junonius]|uniref:Secreted protein n=1 Tax=Gymnopilus junonius TaxID=109634 RepID=A0A9P5TLL7_GYMJU|nr:hypothetical protein CPB84DRAFT_1785180 [Gymnopilus junonius]